MATFQFRFTCPKCHITQTSWEYKRNYLEFMQCRNPACKHQLNQQEISDRAQEVIYGTKILTNYINHRG